MELKYKLSVLFFFCFVVVDSGLIAQSLTNPVDYRTEIENWDKKRITNLKDKFGWVNLAGLLWLKEGENIIGTSDSCDVILPGGEKFSGIISLKGDSVHLKAANPSLLKISNQYITESELKTDKAGTPTLVEMYPYAWTIIRRGQKTGMRLRNYEHPNLKILTKIERFKVDETWKIVGKKVELNPPVIIKIPNALGKIDTLKANFKVRFVINKVEYDLFPSVYENSLFFVIGDLTNGKETYGAGRFLYADLPDSNGTVTLDFNKMYNPPCVFTEFATCPLPPKENKLKLKIQAGEKTPSQLGHH